VADRARELLDAYAARPLPDHVDVVSFDDTAETFAPEAIAALRAVLEEHAPEDEGPQYPPGTRLVCTGCLNAAGEYREYPCATVNAITTALEAP